MSNKQRAARRAQLKRELLLHEAVAFFNKSSIARHERNHGRIDSARRYAAQARACWRKVQGFLQTGKVPA